MADVPCLSWMVTGTFTYMMHIKVPQHGWDSCKAELCLKHRYPVVHMAAWQQELRNLKEK